MEETRSQVCVKTFLSCSKQVKQEIEEVVQLRSRVEAYGNCVFTLALLLQFKKTGNISEKACCQSAVSAAMRSVCLRRGKGEKPAAIKYGPCRVAESFLLLAQKTTTDAMKTFDDDSQLTETFNQSARQYITVFQTNVSEHFEKWLSTALQLDLEQLREYPHASSKSSKNFILRSVQSRVLGKVVRNIKEPNVNMYKDEAELARLKRCFLPTEDVETLIGIYKTAFDKASGSTMVGNLKYGLKSKTYIFVGIGLFLASRMEARYVVSGSKRHRPYQVIPQMKMKVRCVTFGTQQTAELIMRMVKKKIEGVEDFIPPESSILTPDATKMATLKCTMQRFDDEKTIKRLKEEIEEGTKECDERSRKTRKRKREQDDADIKKLDEKIKKKQKEIDDRIRIDQKRPSKRAKKSNEKYYENLSRDQWVSVVPYVFERLFQVPRRIKAKHLGVMTTDGISASWHCSALATATSTVSKRFRENDNHSASLQWPPRHSW